MLSAAHLKPIDLKQIKISSVIGSGTFSIVNKCTLHSFECAIKRLTIDKNNRSSTILESLVSEYALRQDPPSKFINHYGRCRRSRW